jgi:arsenate reductase (thioredoxin)
MRQLLPFGLVILVMVLFLPSSSFGQDSKVKTANEGTILFVCEHGAAKSVIAAAYFDKLAIERGLKHRAVFRGTNPDSTLAPAAEKGLKEDGINTSGWKPELVTKKDMDSASRIVTLGCALPEKPGVAKKVVEWNGVPSPSQNYQAARDDIVKRVQSLIDDLAKNEREAQKKEKTRP